MRATFVVEGTNEVVATLLRIILDEGALVSLESDNNEVIQPPRERRRREPNRFSVGERVKVVHYRTAYGVPEGMCGIVRSWARQGQGASVEVAWDGGAVSNIAASTLKRA